MPRAKPTPFKVTLLQPVREPFRDVAKTFPLQGADSRRVDRFVSGISKAVVVRRASRTGAFTPERGGQTSRISAAKFLAVEPDRSLRKPPKKARRNKIKHARKRSARRLTTKAARARKLRFVRIDDVLVLIPPGTKALPTNRFVLPVIHKKPRRRQKYTVSRPKAQATASK